jgi:putative Mg2+ transporter-C (MgtC) family protein
MNLIQFIDSINSPYVNLGSTAFKLVLAVIAGGLVGLNRERQNQPAGFRTHVLICLGATLLMVLSVYIPQTYFDFKNGDPGRIAAQVVSGIGFLGAGAIIRLGNSVKGITTAASIWLTSAIGLCIGAGLYIISACAVALALFTLVVLEIVERKWFSHPDLKSITFEFASTNIPAQNITQLFKQYKITSSDYKVICNPEGMWTEYKIVAKIPENIELSQFIERLNQLPDIRSIKID